MKTTIKNWACRVTFGSVRCCPPGRQSLQRILTYAEYFGYYSDNASQKAGPGEAVVQIPRVSGMATMIRSVFTLFDWNLIEILVIANRIRFVANGTLIFDFTDKPDDLQSSPIGLQLRSNDRPQEHFFRGLVATKDPADRLITLSAHDRP